MVLSGVTEGYSLVQGAESQSIIKSLKKRVDDLSYNAGVAKDYSREIHYDPALGAESRAQDKKERIKELDQIIKEINDNILSFFRDNS